jgi:hypothetical protein
MYATVHRWQHTITHKQRFCAVFLGLGTSERKFAEFALYICMFQMRKIQRNRGISLPTKNNICFFIVMIKYSAKSLLVRELPPMNRSVHIHIHRKYKEREKK